MSVILRLVERGPMRPHVAMCRTIVAVRLSQLSKVPLALWKGRARVVRSAMLVVLVDRPTSNEHEGLEDENNDITERADTLVHKESDKEVAKTRAVIDLSTAPFLVGSKN